MGNVTDAKVKQYQSFIDDKLKVDLTEIETSLKLKVDKHREWEELKSIASVMGEANTKEINLQVPVGCDIYVNAETDSLDTLFVNVGLGCLLQMNRAETEKYCTIRMNALKKEIAHYRSLAVQVKTNIKLSLLAVNELGGP